MPPTRIAALDRQCLISEDGGVTVPLPELLPIVTAARLFEIMDRSGTDVLHVHSSALERIGLPVELKDRARGESRPDHPFVADVTYRGERINQRALAPSIRCGRREIIIGAYQGHGAGDPFAEAKNAGELAAAQVAFRDAFRTPDHPNGFAYKNSAQVTGSQLMHAPWRRRRGAPDLRKRIVIPELAGHPPGAMTEKPFVWTRDKTIPSHHKHVAAWDINSQRLSACSGLALGIEGIEHRPGTEFDKRLPGYHHVIGMGAPGSFDLPWPMEIGWHATPLVAMAIELGFSVAITDSIVWTEHKRYLEPFYQTMRDARNKLIDQMTQGEPGAERKAAMHAAAALKDCYLQPFGRFRSIKSREEDSPYYRPHWYDSLISNELARQYLTMYRLAAIPVPILAIYFDTIIIETDDPSTPPHPIVVSNQLGKYKPVGNLSLKQARAILYDGERPKPGALVKELKQE